MQSPDIVVALFADSNLALFHSCFGLLASIQATLQTAARIETEAYQARPPRSRWQ